MADPSVSVIIPVYNGERFLAEAIRSVLDQSRPPTELIVVDDGSTDGSAGIAQGFEGVRYLHQANAGQPAALNHGVSVAEGRFLGFLDADDVWVSDKLAVQLEAFESDSALDMVFGQAQQFIQPDAPAAVVAQFQKEREILPAHLPSAMLIRREAFDRVGGFRSEWKIGNVVDWYARAIEAGLRSRMLDCVVYRRRIHGTNISITEKQSQKDYLAIVKAALDRRRAQQNQGTSDSADG
jgi:glycosyltransferase involved in cell wall biosynthesis